MTVLSQLGKGSLEGSKSIKNTIKEVGVAVRDAHIWNPSSGETEAGGLRILKPA